MLPDCLVELSLLVAASGRSRLLSGVARTDASGKLRKRATRHLVETKPLTRVEAIFSADLVVAGTHHHHLWSKYGLRPWYGFYIKNGKNISISRALEKCLTSATANLQHYGINKMMHLKGTLRVLYSRQVPIGCISFFLFFFLLHVTKITWIMDDKRCV